MADDIWIYFGDSPLSGCNRHYLDDKLHVQAQTTWEKPFKNSLQKPGPKDKPKVYLYIYIYMYVYGPSQVCKTCVFSHDKNPTKKAGNFT